MQCTQHIAAKEILLSWDLLSQQTSSFWILASVGVYLTAVTKSGFAGATGVVAVPLMSLAIDPRLAASMLLPLLILMDIANVKIYRGQQHKGIFKSLLVGSFAGLVLGMLCFHLLNGASIKLLVGVIGLFFALNNFAKRDQSAVQFSPLVSKIIGLISGFTSFIAHAGGPPLNGYLITAKIKKREFLATVSLVLAITNFAKLPAYALVGQVNMQLGAFVLLMLPIAYLGMKTGYWAKDKISDKYFNQIMNSLLLLVSLILLINGVISLGIF